MMIVVFELIRAGMIGLVRALSLIVLVAMMVTVIMEQPAVGASLLGSWIVWRVTSRNEEESDDE